MCIEDSKDIKNEEVNRIKLELNGFSEKIAHLANFHFIGLFNRNLGQKILEKVKL